jgi:hypothetical protein
LWSEVESQLADYIDADAFSLAGLGIFLAFLEFPEPKILHIFLF